MEALLEDVAERIETERLILRVASGRDAATLNAAVCESLDDLRVCMPWAQTAPSLAQSNADCRRMQAKFLLREDLAMFVDNRNERSWRVAQRAGFVLEGVLRSDALNPLGVARDTRVYALTGAGPAPEDSVANA